MLIKKKESKVTLPPGVPSRILFQCGPSGEDPLADILEREFSSILVEDSANCSVVIKGGDARTIEMRIREWICALKRCELIVGETSTPVVMTAVREEVTHFIRNSPWICSAQVDANIVTMIGCAVAVKICSDRLRASLAHLNVDFAETYTLFSLSEQGSDTTAPSAIGSIGSDSHIFRFVQSVGNKRRVPAYLDEETWKIPNLNPVVPVSIFDSLDDEADTKVDNVRSLQQLTTFSRRIKVDKIHSVPQKVLERLQSVVGIGCMIRVVHNGFVDIHVSSCESDLDLADSMVRACASRRVSAGGNGCSELHFPMKMEKDILQQMETQFRVVVVVNDLSSSLLILGPELNRKRCEIELMQHAESKLPSLYTKTVRRSVTSVIDDSVNGFTTDTLEDVGSDLSRKGKAGEKTCSRVASASAAAVGLVGDVLFVGGDCDSRKFARKCIDLLMRKAADHYIEGAIVVPVNARFAQFRSQGKGKKQMDALESKHGCIIYPQPSRFSTFISTSGKEEIHSSLQVISRDPLARACAALDLIALCESLTPGWFDLTSLSPAHGVASVSFSCSDGPRLARIEALDEALNVHTNRIGEELVITGSNCARVEAAVQLVNRFAGRPFSQAKLDPYTRRVETEARPPPCSESIGTSIGCLCFFDSDFVEIISASVVRREICALIVSAKNPEDELDLVTAPWRSHKVA